MADIDSKLPDINTKSNKNQHSIPIFKPRKFPVLLLLIAAIFLSIISAASNYSAVSNYRDVILLSLSYLMFTMSFFLVLIVLFYKINILIKQWGKEGTFQSSSGFLFPVKTILNKVWMHITNFYSEERVSIKPEEFPDFDKEKPIEVEKTIDNNGLIEIQKDYSLKHNPENKKPIWAKLEFFYVISFIFIALWRLNKMFVIIPLSYAGFYARIVNARIVNARIVNARIDASIIDAILLLIFPCVATIYLKMRKNEGSCSGDKTSRDLLILLSFISLVYAIIIAITLVFNINILFILQWVFYIAMIYLITVFAFNILFSILKKNVFSDFNYTLFPEISKINENKTAYKNSGFFGLEEIEFFFSFKSLYTVRYILKILPGLILALIFILLLSTTIFVVQPHQQAAVYRFGKLSRSSIIGEGIHFKLPLPIDKVNVYDVHRINSMQIGYESPYNINFLWAQFHTGGEYLLLLGNGNEKVSVNMTVFYRISDLYTYIKTNTTPEAILSAAAYEALLDRTVNTTLDAFLSIDRSSLSFSILDELLQFSKKEGLGLSVTQVIIESIHPPFDVTDVYQRVVSASIERNTAITVAETEAETRLIDADRQNRTIVNYAKTSQHNRVSSAMQEMAVYYAAMEAHRLNPQSFQLTKYLDIFEKVVGDSKVYVFSPGMEDNIPRSFLGQFGLPGILGY